jgi:hypothetical protein
MARLLLFTVLPFTADLMRRIGSITLRTQNR